MRITYTDHPDDLKNAEFLGAKALETMHRHARATGLPLAAAALELADSDELPARTRATIAQLMAGFLRWRELAATVMREIECRELLRGAEAARREAESRVRELEARLAAGDVRQPGGVSARV